MTNGPIVEPQVFTTENYVSSAGVKLLVYGPPHKGKTDAIKTLPAPLVLAAEHGLTTLNKYKIPYTPVTTVKQLQDMVTWIKARRYVGKFQSFALDSLSYLCSCLLAEFRNNPAKYTNNGIKHYGMLKDNIVDLLQALHECDAHVYVTAWQEEIYDTFGNKTGIAPYTDGQSIKTFLIHYFDLTAHLNWHNIPVTNADGTTTTVQQPFYQTVEANGVFARSRKVGLEAFEPADLGALINKLSTL